MPGLTGAGTFLGLLLALGVWGGAELALAVSRAGKECGRRCPGERPGEGERACS